MHPMGNVLDELVEPPVAQTWSRCSRRPSPALPLIWSMLATMPSRSPNCVIHFAAVLGPTRARPGGCRTSPPTIAARSLYRAGARRTFLDLRGPHAPHLGHAAHRVEDRDVVADELERVAVARADEDLDPLCVGLGGDGRDDVVGLVAVELAVTDPERVEHLLDEWQLTAELVRVRARPALYSVYSSVRNVWRDLSNATATCVGCSSRSMLMSIDVKP